MTRSEDLRKEQVRVRKEVIEAIQEAMNAQRITLYHLSKDSEVSQSSIRAIFAGKTNTRFDTIVKICTSLGIKIMVI